MHKFKNINVKGQDNSKNITQQNSGGNNIQTTSIINNNYTNKSDNQDPSAIGAIAIAGGFSLLFTLWSLFANIDKVYIFLKLAAITSPLFAIAGISILTFRDEITKNDVFRVGASLILAGMTFLLNEFFRLQIPQDIVNLSHQASSVWKFWAGLNAYGKNTSLAILISSISIALSAIINHFISIRQLLYALSNPDMTGFWFSRYNFTSFFKVRISGAIMIMLLAFATFSLQGSIFHLNFS